MNAPAVNLTVEQGHSVCEEAAPEWLQVSWTYLDAKRSGNRLVLVPVNFEKHYVFVISTHLTKLYAHYRRQEHVHSRLFRVHGAQIMNSSCTDRLATATNACS